MKLTEELKAKISAEIDRRMDGHHNAPTPLPQDYWSKHDCEDYDDGNGICAWCGKAVHPEIFDIEFSLNKETFTREEIALAIKSTLASLYEECESSPYDWLAREKEAHHEALTTALMNLGFRLNLDDLICDEDGSILLCPSKDNKRLI